MSLFDKILWLDPISGRKMEPVIQARTPGGVPISGALRISGTEFGYPIVDSVARITPELAAKYSAWLRPLNLEPPQTGGRIRYFQAEATVESFGFQWAWNSRMRTEEDLQWRVASRFRVPQEEFRGKLVLDAGAGAGDQSKWLSEHGAPVVSLDLSSAIDVAARKLRLCETWVGVQGDITALPFDRDQFDLVYCEGVIQHTQDSARAVKELARVLQVEGKMLATHYERPMTLKGKLKQGLINSLRHRLCKFERYKLLWVTGTLAAVAYVPLIGWFARKSGLATYSELMPDFKTTWTNTFDSHGNHSYQRHISPEEFWAYFDQAGKFAKVFSEGNLVVATKKSSIA